MKHINEYINEQLNDVIIQEGLWRMLKFKIGQLFSWISTKVKDMLKTEYNTSGNSLYHFSPNYVDNKWTYWEDNEFDLKHICILKGFESQEKMNICDLVSDAIKHSDTTCPSTRKLVTEKKNEFLQNDKASIFAFIYSISIKGKVKDVDDIKEYEKDEIYASFAVLAPFVIDDSENMTVKIELINTKQIISNKNAIIKRVTEILKEYIKQEKIKIHNVEHHVEKINFENKDK